MWKKRKPESSDVSASKEGTSASTDGQQDPQLSESNRVQEDVGSIALNHGLLAMGARASTAVADPIAGGLTDADVMLRVKAGDDSAFDYLVQKYRRQIINFMYRMAHNSAAAEDLAQEVFLRVYRSRANYEPSAKFTTWLYRIATNLGVNYARDTRHERPENVMNLDEPDSETGQAQDLADKTPSVEEEILRRERLAAIKAKVEALRKQISDLQRVPAKTEPGHRAVGQEAGRGDLDARLRQQAAVAELGQRALVGTDLPTLMADAVRLVARTLELMAFLNISLNAAHMRHNLSPQAEPA